MMNKHCPRSHSGYYREDDDLSVNDGAVQRNKDWSTYRKTDTFIAVCAAIVLASIIGGGIAIGVHCKHSPFGYLTLLSFTDTGKVATGGSATGDVGHGSAAHIVPRFPVMQFNAAHSNGTRYGINSTLSGSSSTGTSSLCSDNAQETEAVTSLTNQTTADVTTTIKMTRTQTFHKSAKGTTVSSAKAVNATLSDSSSSSESVPVVTQAITTSVTETAYLTATATESHGISGPDFSLSSSKASTGAFISEATTSQVETSSVDVVSVVLTKTLVETRVVTSTAQEVVSTITYTPTTIIRSTVTVTPQPFVSPSQEAQCSREVRDHTVYVTITETAAPGSSVSTSVSSKAPKTSTSAPAPEAADTIVVTYTVTVDSLTPISKVPVVSSPSDVSKNSTKVSSHSNPTRVVTEVATQVVYVTVADGTTAFSTAVSSVLGHASTPAHSTETAQAPTATGVVVITKTVIDQVFQTVSASPTPSVDVETDTQTSVITVTALPGTPSGLPRPSKSILTTLVLTDRATKTVTIGGMATVTVRPETSTSSASGHNSTRTDTKLITEIDIRTLTVTVSGHVQTSLVTVHKNLTATVTQTRANSTAVGISTDVFRLPPANTTVYISGTPMMHPRPTTATFPPYAITNGTVFRPTTPLFQSSGSASGSRPPTSSTVVVVSNAEKRAEPVMFGLDAATGGCKSCTTCLVIFVLGLLVLF
ncbi:hypothetical protein ColLi_09550 [Colletotrichum liriopes]|uniref:Uncharacterized protein n=1 Tax=Colletotrichum liriopes TaxID=708192 RepID=A0AA37LW57_9PEZI|nr:hypothetical protein ColLi_09550 [Colletotrichum liriopes]